MEILHSEDTSGEAMEARSFKLVVATWQIIALVLRPPLRAPAMDVGLEAYIPWPGCETVIPGSPTNFLI